MGSPNDLGRSSLAVASHLILVSGELVYPYRSTSMKASCGDSDLGSHSELASVGELGGGVVHHDGTVHSLEKMFSSFEIFGENALQCSSTLEET